MLSVSNRFLKFGQQSGRSRSFASALFVALVAAGALLLPAVPQTVGRSLYVAPNGSPANDGSISRPLDLATAIASNSPALPGDTIWLRGGIYSGAFTSNLTGTAAAPITVRQYPGERATIDGAPAPTLGTFVVLGAWTTYMGFEITNSYPNRVVDINGRGTGLDVYGPNTKFINMIVHDAQVGIGFWTPAVNSELYGNIIYNNGIEWTDRGHGHSIYTQNQTGTKRIADNILFNSFSFGIHAYTEGGAINNLLIDGNVSFNHGVLSAVSGAKSNLLLGGGQVAHNATITNNFLYDTPGNGGRGADIGYGVACADSNVQNNSFIADTTVAFNCSNTTFSGNTLYGGGAPAIAGNMYYAVRPTGTWVYVRPNQYEAGRANIIVYNWSKQSQVFVDLTAAGLNVGDAFEIRDAQNYLGAPVVTGSYSGGPVMVPMTGLTVAAPIGNAPIMPPHTSADFGVFVVARPSSATAPAPSPTASLSAAPISISSGQSATLTWSTTNATSVQITPAPGTVAASGSVSVTPTVTTTYTLKATSQSGVVATSAAVVTVAAAPPTGTKGTAVFVGTDANTQGNWRGVYGAGGYAFPSGTSNLPASAPLALTGQSSWLWAGQTSDVRALQNPNDANRSAATWYAAGTFSLDLNLTDGVAHKLALYELDWDALGRAQTFDVVDAVTGAVLDHQSTSGFANGQYVIWQISGHVIIRTTRVAGANGVVSGLFLDAIGTAPAPPPPPPPPPPPGTGSTAAFVGVDATTQGNWIGSYGIDGYALPTAGTSVRTAVQLGVTGLSWVWAGSTTDVRALQNPTTGRSAVTWYGDTVNIDVNTTDGLSHRVAVYAIDWDANARVESLDVLDAATGTVLNHQTASAFTGGQYWVWRVTGHVIIRATRTGGPNAVAEGVFLDK